MLLTALSSWIKIHLNPSPLLCVFVMEAIPFSLMFNFSHYFKPKESPVTKLGHGGSQCWETAVSFYFLIAKECKGNHSRLKIWAFDSCPTTAVNSPQDHMSFQVASKTTKTVFALALSMHACLCLTHNVTPLSCAVLLLAPRIAEPVRT